MDSPQSKFKRLQREWYERIKKDGFEDIEDHNFEEKPLKRWSGIPAVGIIDAFAYQEAGISVQSSFPEKRFVKEERLLNHADFDDICRSICSHGNHRLVVGDIKAIWERHLEGETNRKIAKILGLHHVSVFRCIATLTKWADTMGEVEEIPEVSTVTIRPFNADTDVPVVYATWRNALWYDDLARDASTNHKFFRECTKLISTIIQNPETQVKIACLSDDPNLVLGYSVLNKSNLVWVYVKSDYRHKGIATLLAQGAETVSAPSTRIGKSIVKDKKLEIKK